jgi:hypothetical protein
VYREQHRHRSARGSRTWRSVATPIAPITPEAMKLDVAEKHMRFSPANARETVWSDSGHMASMLAGGGSWRGQGSRVDRSVTV